MQDRSEREMVAVVERTERPAHHPANVFKVANDVVIVPLNDVCNTVGTMYGYGAFYAMLVSGKPRQFFNLMYFVPTLIPLSIHVLPFKPENKKFYQKKLNHVLYVALNSAFMSAAAQQVFLAVASDISQTNRIIGVAVIQGVTTLLALPFTYFELKMQDGEELDKSDEMLVKFGLHPLQSAAALGFFVDIFDGHLHLLPSWASLAIGGGLGVTRLVYEIVSHNVEAAKQTQRFVDMVVQEILNHLSTDSILFTIVLSLYAANNNGIIPDGLFYSMIAVCSAVFGVSSVGSVISYMYHEEDQPQLNETEEETESLLREDSQEEVSSDSPRTSQQGMFATAAEAPSEKEEVVSVKPMSLTLSAQEKAE